MDDGCLNSTHLADHEFVTIVVAGQVGEDASSTCHYIDVITAQQLNQGAQKTLHSLLERAEDGLIGQKETNEG